MPLSFYRQGSIAYTEQRHIEAIYQFYFLFETLFGNGKMRNRAIKQNSKRPRCCALVWSIFYVRRSTNFRRLNLLTISKVNSVRLASIH